jgi:NAD(P)-dependent dehydrogenase (short-subunit alcohol dehydrogenase family)
MTHYSGIAGKRVLVTGATSGLALAMAQALVTEGAGKFLHPDSAISSIPILRDISW